jgi:molybdate transport system substrate-binding protein
MLARQIEEGAPCDVFISADMEQIQKLAAKMLVEPGSHRLVASNSLVIVTERGNPLRISAPAGLAAARRIAFAETRTVPAGVYARRFLEQRGLWAAIQPKVVPTQNVRGALAAVESGNADAAVVYKTDARMARGAEVAFEVPAAETPYIASSAAVPATARNPRGAREFLEFLQSEPAAAVLRHFGFVVPAKPANL